MDDQKNLIITFDQPVLFKSVDIVHVPDFIDYTLCRATGLRNVFS